jgi:hypothetical protein
MVHVTEGLLDILLQRARERDPESVTIGLAVTPAEEFADLDLDPGTPVFTTFYLPDAGRSVEAVFGSDLGTPAGQTPGLFVSHPNGSLSVSRTDDLREVVFVAVPPYDRASVAAFGRDGRRRDLHVVDAEPPEESLP